MLAQKAKKTATISGIIDLHLCVRRVKYSGHLNLSPLMKFHGLLIRKPKKYQWLKLKNNWPVKVLKKQP
jgi:hypothetical protein